MFRKIELNECQGSGEGKNHLNSRILKPKLKMKYSNLKNSIKQFSN